MLTHKKKLNFGHQNLTVNQGRVFEMKFEKITVELEKYESLDIIASSPEEDVTDPTVKPTEPTKYDPYENDKW